MIEETTKRDRSPNFPKMPLDTAIEYTKRLYAKIGKTQVKTEASLSALGYSSLNGAALTTVGALSQYGLVSRDGGSIGVTQLGIKVIHPLNPTQEAQSLREAALRPKVFSDLFTGGFQDCDESILSNHLIQIGFTSDGAKRAASVFKANYAFAKLADSGSVSVPDESNQSTVEPELGLKAMKPVLTPPLAPPLSVPEPVLARYSIPLGSNEATLIFKGDKLSPEDFDDLAEYVMMFKKQLERKLKADHSKRVDSEGDSE